MSKHSKYRLIVDIFVISSFRVNGEATARGEDSQSSTKHIVIGLGEATFLH